MMYSVSIDFQRIHINTFIENQKMKNSKFNEKRLFFHEISRNFEMVLSQEIFKEKLNKFLRYLMHTCVHILYEVSKESFRWISLRNTIYRVKSFFESKNGGNGVISR